VRDIEQEKALQRQISISEQNIHSLMAVPLQTENEVIGLVYVDSRLFVREFTPDDLNLLTVLANVAAIRIDHERAPHARSAAGGGDPAHAAADRRAAPSGAGAGRSQRSVPHGRGRLLRFHSLPGRSGGGARRRCRRQGDVRGRTWWSPAR
jgi:GAF domain-containing protein